MARIGRADIEEASRAVNVSSRARQLCYPRGNFSVGSAFQIINVRGSLCPCFQLAIPFVRITIRRPFAITLFMTFLPPLRSSLGGPVIFSGPCHPSTTAHLHVSPKLDKFNQYSHAVFHCCLHYPRRGSFADSRIHSVQMPIKQVQTAVKLYGVFFCHMKAPYCSTAIVTSLHPSLGQ